MPEMSKAVIPPHMGGKQPSEKIIALEKKITDVAGHKLGKVTVEDPEYWGLAEIVTEEMAEVGLTMKLRHHYTFAELCKMNKITKDKDSRGEAFKQEAQRIQESTEEK